MLLSGGWKNSDEGFGAEIGKIGSEGVKIKLEVRRKSRNLDENKNKHY